MMLHLCPFCGWPSTEEAALLGHVLEAHVGVAVGRPGQRLQGIAGDEWGDPFEEGQMVFQCWCGYRTFYAPRRLSEQDLFQHLEGHGGLHCHVLELALGVDDDA